MRPGSILGTSSRPPSGPGPGTAVPWDLGTPPRAPQVGRTLPAGTEAGRSGHPRASVCPVARDDGPDGDWATCARVATLPAPCLARGAPSEVRRLGRGRGALVRHVSSAGRGDVREEEPSTLTGKWEALGDAETVLEGPPEMRQIQQVLHLCVFPPSAFRSGLVERLG